VGVAWVTVEVLGLGLAFGGFGFVATVVGVVGVLAAAVVLLLEEEPQAAMTRTVATVASDAVAVVRRFLIFLKRRHRRRLLPDHLLTGTQIILATCTSRS
jgi:hypothetical protein